MNFFKIQVPSSLRNFAFARFTKPNSTVSTTLYATSHRNSSILCTGESTERYHVSICAPNSGKSIYHNADDRSIRFCLLTITSRFSLKSLSSIIFNTIHLAYSLLSHTHTFRRHKAVEPEKLIYPKSVVQLYYLCSNHRNFFNSPQSLLQIHILNWILYGWKI